MKIIRINWLLGIVDILDQSDQPILPTLEPSYVTRHKVDTIPFFVKGDSLSQFVYEINNYTSQ